MESEGPLNADKSLVDNNNHTARFFKWSLPHQKTQIKKGKRNGSVSFSLMIGVWKPQGAAFSVARRGLRWDPSNMI